MEFYLTLTIFLTLILCIRFISFDRFRTRAYHLNPSLTPIAKKVVYDSYKTKGIVRIVHQKLHWKTSTLPCP